MDDYPAADDVPPPAAEYQFQELMQFLTESRDMRKAARSSVKQGLYAGTGAIAGGFLLGPVGGLVGGIAGSLAGFFQSDDYDGAVLQIMQLDQGPQRDQLLRDVGQVLKTAGATAQQFESADAFRGALMQFAQSSNVRDQIWKACIEASSSGSRE